MKYLTLLILIFVVTACDPYNLITDNENNNDTIVSNVDVLKYVYDKTAIPEIYMEFSTEEWNKLLINFDQNPNNEEYIKGNFSFNKNGTKVKLNNIGMRLRGNTSRRRPEGGKNELHNTENPDWHHASFSVKFNNYITGQRMAGVDKINLKWFKDDAMYVREVYCYDLFERFGVWTAPKSSYCKLSIKIKGDNKIAYFGVYELLEPVDVDYLNSRKDKFADTNGYLWKANYGADLVNADRNNMSIESISLTQTYTPVYDLKTQEENLEIAKTQLADFIVNFKTKSGENFKTWISEKMDVELFLRTYAVNVMCGMWDDYWNNKNNFYIYFDSNGKFYFIPFDYDNTLGTSLIISDSGKRDVMNWGNNKNNLVKKIISIPEFESLYKSYIHELCSPTNDFFDATKSKIRITNWQNMIRNFITNDTGEDMELIDEPASWGNCKYYRLLEVNNNFFTIRSANIPN